MEIDAGWGSAQGRIGNKVTIMPGHAICMVFAWSVHDRYLVNRAVPVLSEG